MTQAIQASLDVSQPDTKPDLDAQLRQLIETHSLGAVGKAIARVSGRTQAIAAVLGQLPDATCSTSALQ
jgi:hypothetical protein